MRWQLFFTEIQRLHLEAAYFWWQCAQYCLCTRSADSFCWSKKNPIRSLSWLTGMGEAVWQWPDLLGAPDSMAATERTEQRTFFFVFACGTKWRLGCDWKQEKEIIKGCSYQSRNRHMQKMWRSEQNERLQLPWDSKYCFRWFSLLIVWSLTEWLTYIMIFFKQKYPL